MRQHQRLKPKAIKLRITNISILMKRNLLDYYVVRLYYVSIKTHQVVSKIFLQSSSHVIVGRFPIILQYDFLFLARLTYRWLVQRKKRLALHSRAISFGIYSKIQSKLQSIDIINWPGLLITNPLSTTISSVFKCESYI